MAKQSSFKINKSFYDKVEALQQDIEDSVKEELSAIARTVTGVSPVDTGAYVTSFSMKTSRSGGRSKSSANKPRFQDKNQKRKEGLELLMEDIAYLDLEGKTSVTLSNGSLHAQDVERRHRVFEIVRNLYGRSI
jgi:hypothetical protein|tara:strand:- start:505 stop:906 length:402 start_codon:yes stop_codon:yes gene_type:complete